MKNYYRDQKISSDIDDYAESLSMSEMDMSHKEIAEQIGISEGNVRVILSRTIKKMCNFYDKRKDFLI